VMLFCQRHHQSVVELLACVWTVDIVYRVTHAEKPPFRPTAPANRELVFTLPYYNLMEQCWNEDPSARPDFKVIVDVLRSFMARRWLTARNSSCVRRTVFVSYYLHCRLASGESIVPSASVCHAVCVRAVVLGTCTCT